MCTRPYASGEKPQAPRERQVMNMLSLKLAGLAVMVIASFGSVTAAASADPVVFNFDESIINLGEVPGLQGLKRSIRCLAG